MNRKIRVGIIAPSSVVPQYEFALGLKRLEKEPQFEWVIHPQTRKRDLFFAGSDEARARGLLEFAQDPSLDVLWCARGGYGAYRLLPLLDEKVVLSQVPPRKLFAGYSDATSLLEYVRTHWGWPTLHCPMPGLVGFTQIQHVEWLKLIHWLRGEQPTKPFGVKKLKFYFPSNSDVVAPIVGGNLSVICGLLGTPYQMIFRDKILFLEDIGETLSRLDRAFCHLEHAGVFSQVRAIVLGDFKDCLDPVPLVLQAPVGKAKPKRAPARRSIPQGTYFSKFWSTIGEKYQLPIAYGLPVGHGPGKFSLPLGGMYRLKPTGELGIESWQGLKP